MKKIIILLRGNLGLWTVLLLVFLIYLPSLGGGFVLDDTPFVKDNPYIRHFGDIARYFTKSLWENSSLETSGDPRYLPMVLVPMLLNYALWGDNPFGYHLFFLLLHLANTCLVYFLIRRIVGGSTISATISSAIFALHPARVESVAWICGGVDPLVTFFLLLAFLAHRSFGERQNSDKRWPYLILSLSCFQLALWSREVAILFPLVLIAYDHLYRKKIYWPEILLQVTIVIGYLISRSIALQGASRSRQLDFTSFSRAADFMLGYSELLVFPSQIPFYLNSPEQAVSSILGWAGVLVMAVLLVFSWRVFDLGKRRTLVLSVIWVLAFFWPAVLMLFYEEGFFFARWLYVPAVGVSIFIAALYEYLSETRPGLKAPLVAACMLLLSIYGLFTWKEIPAWHDDGALYGKVVKLAPNYGDGYCALGQYYFLQNDTAMAEKNYLLCLQKTTNPIDRVTPLINLGTIQGMRNNLIKSERYLQEALQIDPTSSEGWTGLGTLALIRGQVVEAISCYEKALAFRSDNYEAAINLATAYEKNGQSDRARMMRRSARR